MATNDYWSFTDSWGNSTRTTVSGLQNQWQTHTETWNSSVPCPATQKKPKNATLKNLQQLHPKGVPAKMSGSSLLNALIDKSPVTIQQKALDAKKPKHSIVPTPKATAMSEEVKATIDPFILEHRVGTTERVTAMDPMSKEFLQSLRIPFAGKYGTKSAASAPQLPQQALESIVGNFTSKLLKSVAPNVNYIQPFHLTMLGRAWDENGWVDPSFRVSTACLQQMQGVAPVEFEAGRVLMDTWQYRPTDFVCSSQLENQPVRATLVNKFEAVKDALVCYSFIVKTRAPVGDVLGGDQSLLHVWVNRTYFEQGGRLGPMYFEEGGASTFILNAVTAALGLKIGATGAITLTVKAGEGTRSVKLNREHVYELLSQGAMVDFDRVMAPGQVTWGRLNSVDWQGVGYELQAGGVMWNLSAEVSHLPWSVQDQRRTTMISSPTIRRSSPVGGGLAGARAIFELTADQRKTSISEAIGKQFWDRIRRDEAAGAFDDILMQLRTEYISGELVEEMKRLNPGISASELFEATWNNSDKVGRFVFERNIPATI